MVEDQILIENAILAFLHHYPEHNWVNDYKVLLAKVRAVKDALPVFNLEYDLVDERPTTDEHHGGVVDD